MLAFQNGRNLHRTAQARTRPMDFCTLRGSRPNEQLQRAGTPVRRNLAKAVLRYSQRERQPVCREDAHRCHQHPLDKPAAFLAVSTEGQLSPDYGAPECLLAAVVRWVDSLVAYKSP